MIVVLLVVFIIINSISSANYFNFSRIEVSNFLLFIAAIVMITPEKESRWNNIIAIRIACFLCALAVLLFILLNLS